MKLSELDEQTGVRRETSDADLEIEGAGLDQAAPRQPTSLSNPRYTGRAHF